MARISTAQQRDAITITSAAREEILILGKHHAIEIQNSGSNNVYYGGSDVADTNGRILFSGDTKIFTNVENTFSIYFVASTGKDSELRVVEYK